MKMKDRVGIPIERESNTSKIVSLSNNNLNKLLMQF